MAATPIERVLVAVPDAREIKPGEWRARCPVHRGASATSLKIATGEDGRALLHCFADCPLDDILAHLGLNLADLFPKDVRGGRRPPGRTAPASPPAPASRGRIAATYDYLDEAGDLRFQTVRLDPKAFRQ